MVLEFKSVRSKRKEQRVMGNQGGSICAVSFSEGSFFEQWKIMQFLCEFSSCHAVTRNIVLYSFIENIPDIKFPKFTIFREIFWLL